MKRWLIFLSAGSFFLGFGSISAWGRPFFRRDTPEKYFTGPHLEIAQAIERRYLIERGADVNAPMTNGVTIAWSLQNRIARQEPGSPTAQKLALVKEAMEKRGVKFPATPPDEVRKERHLDVKN